MAATTQPQLPAGASVSDVLTTLQNLVTALNAASQAYVNVNGALNAAGITAPKIIKSSAGRIAVVSVLVAGSSVGVIYDATSLTDTTKPLGVIPNTVGTYAVNMPASFGIVCVPGTGQQITVSYS